MSSEAPYFVICIPVYNDWNVAGLLLGRLDKLLREYQGKFSVVLVDDGSNEKIPTTAPSTWGALKKVELLKLRRNLGHQRAIAIGLSYIYAHRPCDAVVVMDSDGQDAPEQVTVLLEKHKEFRGEKVVFAQRAKRVERFTFRTLYYFYKILHWILTGKRVEVGNFSILPFTALSRLMASSELWNHYAAAVVKSRMPMEKIPLQRAERMKDKSKMNTVDLVIHGLSAISVFSEEMCVRLLIFMTSFMFAAFVSAATMLGIGYSTQTQVPAWAIAILGLLFLGLLNGLLLAFIFAFVILQRRSNANFLPLRDFEYYIMETVSLL